MDIIIACNKQLPLRYYSNEGVWIRRGTHFSDRRLPFFVEVEVGQQLECLHDYIAEIESQYKTFELEVIVRNKALKSAVEALLSYGTLEDGRIYIVK
ncbi:hypothetical protein [Lysinibacillus odysseyi]|uniref:hypothetical protein n=1 Tax=Lysinibacillus odysseyi TaxID=202611 RepID=UPI00068D02E6|nr:hypothetical protein [Lysinibacillus odysseyi]